MMKKVSIIIVNYNGAKDTIECVSSIKKSDYLNIDIVIVDNASTDQSIALLTKEYNTDKSVTIICSKINKGFSGGNNIGIKHAIEKSTDYIMLLNNDTIVDSCAVSNLIRASEKHKEDCVITGKIYYYYYRDYIWYAGGKYVEWKGTTVHIGEQKRDCEEYSNEYEIDFVCGCLWFMSKKVFKKIGLMSEEYFLYSEDLDYSFKAKMSGIKLLYVPQSKIYHKISTSTSKTTRDAQYYIIRNRFYIIKKFHKGFKKISAYFYSIFWCCKRVKNHDFGIETCKKALTDFRYNKMGKR